MSPTLLYTAHAGSAEAAAQSPQGKLTLGEHKAGTLMACCSPPARVGVEGNPQHSHRSSVLAFRRLPIESKFYPCAHNLTLLLLQCNGQTMNQGAASNHCRGSLPSPHPPRPTEVPASLTGLELVIPSLSLPSTWIIVILCHARPCSRFCTFLQRIKSRPPHVQGKHSASELQSLIPHTDCSAF